MENTEVVGSTASAEQTQTSNLNNLSLNDYYDGTYTIPNEWMQSVQIPTWANFSSSDSYDYSKLV